MERVADSRMLYRDIRKEVTKEISQNEIIKYLREKNSHWNDDFCTSIDWKSMEAYLDKMAKIFGQRVTNILKLVHGRQHDRYQKELFYEECDRFICHTGWCTHPPL